MLTDEDIKKLVQVFATKENLDEAVSVLATKADTNNILNAIDAFAKKTINFETELMAVKSAIKRHEELLKQKQ